MFEEVGFCEDVEEVQGAEGGPGFEGADGVFLAVVCDSGEELGVDYEGFEVWEAVGEGCEEAGWVAHGEEFEGERFDRLREGRD